MERSHFQLTQESKVNTAGVTLYRIIATQDSTHARKGQKGGWVEKKENLSGCAWVSYEAEIFGNSHVSGKAFICHRAKVSGNAQVKGNVLVYDEAEVSGSVCLDGDLHVYDKMKVGF